MGNGGGIGHRSRVPHLGGVKQRKPGSQREAGSSDTGANGLLAVGSDTLMGTAERCDTAADDEAAHVTTARGASEARDRDIPAARAVSGSGAGPAAEAVGGAVPRGGTATADGQEVEFATANTAWRESDHRTLWVEEPARRRRLPDPVRVAAVRAVLIISVTLIQAVVAFLCTMAESWLAFPMVISSVASTVVATWAALDVWVTRQVWNQRYGVVSMPSSTARALRRERHRTRRQERATERNQRRTGRGGRRGAAVAPLTPDRLSHR